MKPSFSIPSSRARFQGLALSALIVLLCVLAVIQHRWLGAIAEAERGKLREEAAQKSADIAQDVDRELTRAFLELRLDARTIDARDGGAFAERFEAWRKDAAHPGLVRSVYVAERPSKGPSRLLRFDPLTRAFVEETWPEALQKVRVAVEAGDDSADPLPLPMAPGIPPIMADVPAILSPAMDVLVRESHRDPKAPKNAAWLSEMRELSIRRAGRSPIEVILLDPSSLRNDLLGGAAAARLGSDSPFDWAVVRGDGTLVKGADAARGGEGDARAPLLRLRLDDLDRSLLRGALPGLPDNVMKSVMESSVRFVVRVGGANGAAHVAGLSGSAPWTLVLRHKEGSIDAAVNAQKRRNTALSASILGVLGLSAGMVFLSARRLQALAAQQVEFVAAVSHELRTPLAVIRSAAENLADGVVQDPGQAKRYGALIRNESVRLTDMVEHVLEFAGADSPARAERGPIDAGEAARAAMAGMEGLAAERGGTMRLEIVGGPHTVKGDLSHLTRAISNLLGNALKYGGSRPQVTLRVAPAEGGVLISVADQGAGLDPAEIPRLFEPFYRGQRASEAQIPGSGLGLALVKRIVEGHGGQVSASNEAHSGALFTILIPAA